MLTMVFTIVLEEWLGAMREVQKKSGEKDLIPLNSKLLTETHFDLFEKFFCDNVKVSYTEVLKVMKANPWYQEKVEFKATCVRYDFLIS